MLETGEEEAKEGNKIEEEVDKQVGNNLLLNRRDLQDQHDQLDPNQLHVQNQLQLKGVVAREGNRDSLKPSHNPIVRPNNLQDKTMRAMVQMITTEMTGIVTMITTTITMMMISTMAMTTAGIISTAGVTIHISIS